MLKTLNILFITIFTGSLLLFLEYCYFEYASCPIRALQKAAQPRTLLNVTHIQPAAPDCSSNQRGVAGILSDDCEPPMDLVGFKIGYWYRTGRTGKFSAFGDGSVLHSGDQIKLMFEPTEESYVYIFMTDSHNNIARLFPPTAFRGAAVANQNPVQKGVQYFVPARHKSFRLDKNQGKETLYFVATRQPDAVLEQQYQTLLTAQRNRDLETITVIQEQILLNMTKKQRIVEPDLENDDSQPVEVIEQGERFTVLPRYFNNLCAECVYKVTFEHR
jgi:hypothetical protein